MPLESGETNRAFARNSLNQRDVAAADMRVTFKGFGRGRGYRRFGSVRMDACSAPVIEWLHLWVQL